MTPRLRQHLELPTDRFYHGALLARNRVGNPVGPAGSAGPNGPAGDPAIKPALGQPEPAEARPR